MSVGLRTQDHPIPHTSTQYPTAPAAATAKEPSPPQVFPGPGLGDLLHGFPVELCFAVHLLDGLSGLMGFRVSNLHLRIQISGSRFPPGCSRVFLPVRCSASWDWDVASVGLHSFLEHRLQLGLVPLLPKALKQHGTHLGSCQRALFGIHRAPMVGSGPGLETGKVSASHFMAMRNSSTNFSEAFRTAGADKSSETRDATDSKP